MLVGLLGLQGAFLDHIRHLENLGVNYTIVKGVEELGPIDGLIIPGGESTVMEKFMAMFGMTNPLRKRIREGLPVWGICAGCILLARKVDGRPGILGTLPVDLRRNAYGRQLESTEQAIDVPALRKDAFPAMFIRSPRIERVAAEVNVLAEAGGDPVFVRRGHMMATTFHPELTGDSCFHEYFLDVVSKSRSGA